MAIPTIPAGIASSSISGSNTGGNVTKPSGAGAGDFYMIVGTSYTYGGTPTTRATSTGFSQIGDRQTDYDTARIITTILAKSYTGSEGATFPVVAPTNTFFAWGTFIVSGASGFSATVANNAQTTRTTTGTIQSVTTSVADSLVIGWLTGYDFAVNTTVSGWVLEASFGSAAHAVWSKDMAVAGSSGTGTVTLGGSDYAHTITIIAEPAGGGPTLSRVPRRPRSTLTFR